MHRQSKRILLIDDDDAFRRTVARILCDAGFTVREAANFTAAMSALDDKENVDLLLTDIVMPAGTPHGFSIAAVARRRRQDLKVLYMTGTDDAEQFALFDPEATVLHKPFTADELRTAIAAALA